MKAPKAKTSDTLETLPMWRARQVSHGAHDVRVVRVGVVVVEARQAEVPQAGVHVGVEQHVVGPACCFWCCVNRTTTRLSSANRWVFAYRPSLLNLRDPAGLEFASFCVHPLRHAHAALPLLMASAGPCEQLKRNGGRGENAWGKLINSIAKDIRKLTWA
jgi:hypothetical protein